MEIELPEHLFDAHLKILNKSKDFPVQLKPSDELLVSTLNQVSSCDILTSVGRLSTTKTLDINQNLALFTYLCILKHRLKVYLMKPGAVFCIQEVDSDKTLLDNFPLQLIDRCLKDDIHRCVLVKYLSFLSSLFSTSSELNENCKYMFSFASEILTVLSQRFPDILTEDTNIFHFTGTKILDKTVKSKFCDLVLIRKMMSVMFLSALKLLSDSKEESCDVVVKAFEKIGKAFLRLASTSLPVWLNLFIHHDIDLINKGLLLSYKLSQLLQHRKLSSGCLNMLNFQTNFLYVISAVNFDASLLIDWLMSPKCSLLEYLLIIIKHLQSDWLNFKLSCENFDKMLHEEKNKFEDCKAEVDVDKESTGHKRTAKDAASVENLVPKRPRVSGKSSIDSVSVMIPDRFGNTIKEFEFSFTKEESTYRARSYESYGLLTPKVIFDFKTNEPVLVRCMSMLIRVRLKLEKLNDSNAFPYNVKPLLNRFVKLEEIYESS